MDVVKRPAVVMDCGSGFSKLGFAGNLNPSFVIPTALAVPDPWDKTPNPIADLDVLVGAEAFNHSGRHHTAHPVVNGVIQDWDLMESFWHQSIYSHLRVEPSEHYFVLTEPPLNTPENREYTAEIMFETFNAPGLLIGVQAVLALYANAASGDQRSQLGGRSLTGTVVDAGDMVTHIIPVVDGYVLGGSIKSLPVAGRDITMFIQHMLDERGDPLPEEGSLEICRKIKERYCYVCEDMTKEFPKHDMHPEKYSKQYTCPNPATGEPLVFSLDYQRFLGPELFFAPGLYGSRNATPLPVAVDSVIQSCPIDTRRALYNNVLLSGGSSMFKGFGRRLKNDLTKLANSRLSDGVKLMEVDVHSNILHKYAAWFGGSVLGSTTHFPKLCHTREQYLEHGASIARSNFVFKDI